VAFCPALDPPHEADPRAVAELVDRRLWPEVRDEYGRLRAAPGVILSALAAVGIGAGLLARRRRRPPPRILGVVEPLRLRRRSARRLRLARLRHPRRR
jgi:hypothetical protein